MIQCLNCGESFDGVEGYQRHQWTAHAGELDRGEAYR